MKKNCVIKLKSIYLQTNEAHHLKFIITDDVRNSILPKLIKFDCTIFLSI